MLTGPSERIVLGGIPALVGVGAIGLTLAAGRLARGLGRRPGRPWLRGALAAVGDGVGEAVELLRSPLVWAGSLGYLLFDLAVLAVSFPGFGQAMPPIDVLLLAYLIGQLGGLVPLPGGIGGLDLGLIGALVLYGVDPTQAAVAVLAYRGLLLTFLRSSGYRPSPFCAGDFSGRTTTSARVRLARRSRYWASAESAWPGRDWWPLPADPTALDDARIAARFTVTS